MPEEPTLDRTDLALLRLLANDARISNKELAAAVGLAPSTCHERLKALREKNILLGSHAAIDLHALGFSTEALLFIQLKKLAATHVDRYLQTTATLPEVRSVSLISGHFDMVVHVTTRTMDHLKHLISESFHQPFILRVETSVIFTHHTNHTLPE